VGRSIGKPNKRLGCDDCMLWIRTTRPENFSFPAGLIDSVMQREWCGSRALPLPPEELQKRTAAGIVMGSSSGGPTALSTRCTSMGCLNDSHDVNNPPPPLQLSSLLRVAVSGASWGATTGIGGLVRGR
jgi:hypothetical protein